LTAGLADPHTLTGSQIAFSTDGTTYGDWTAFSEGMTYTFTGTHEDGDTLTLHAKLRNGAGIEAASAVSDGIVYDTSAPVVSSFKLNSGASYTNNSTIAVTFSVADSTGTFEYILGSSVSVVAIPSTAPDTGWSSLETTGDMRISYLISTTFANTEDPAYVYIFVRDGLGQTSGSTYSVIIKSLIPTIASEPSASSSSGPSISFTNGATAVTGIQYWTGNRSKASAIVDNATIHFLEIAIAADETITNQSLSNLSSNGPFTFLLVDETDRESIAYGFDYTDSNYSSFTLRSISRISNSIKTAHTVPTTTYTAPTSRRPTSYITPIAFTTSPATTPARWLSPMSPELVSTLTRTPMTATVTPRLSASAQAKANAILAAYSKPSTDTSRSKPLAKAPFPRADTADSHEDKATPITTTPDSLGEASIFLTGYSSQPGTSPSSTSSPAPDNTQNPSPDRTPGPNPDRSNGNSSGLPPAEAVLPTLAQTKRHDEGSEEPGTL
jgi:hypothetical protein